MRDRDMFKYSRKPRERLIRKTIERRTPDGLLISVTNQETIEYADYDRYREERNYVPVRTFYRSVPELRENVPYEETTRARNGTSSSNREYIVRSPSSPSPALRREEYHVRRTTVRSPSPNVYIDPSRMCGNSTLYGDDWSDAGDEVKNAYIVRRNSVRGMPNLATLQDRINDYRRAYKVPQLAYDKLLGREAHDWIDYLVDNDDFRAKNSCAMHLWMGDNPSTDIAEVWNFEADHFSTKNYFADQKLRRMGLARSYNPRTQQSLVVALYE